MTRIQIIQAIEDYAERKGIAPATVTSRAVGNSRLYRRMKSGGDCTTGIAGRIIAYIEGDKFSQSRHSNSSASSPTREAG